MYNYYYVNAHGVNNNIILLCDRTVKTVRVWRDVLMDWAGTRTRIVIHQTPMHKHGCSTAVLHWLGMWRCQ